MRQIFVSNIAAQDEEDVLLGFAPWATEIIEVCGGWRAFESSIDAEIWKRQV